MTCRSVEPKGLAGSRVSRHPGSGDDYYGMREFRPGDSIRHIPWKRSACLDQLGCPVRTRATPPRLRVPPTPPHPPTSTAVAGTKDVPKIMDGANAPHFLADEETHPMAVSSKRDAPAHAHL